MTHFTRYDPQTGRIHSQGECHVSDYLLQGAIYPDLGLIDQRSDLDLDYVDLAAEPWVRRRPAMAFDRLEIAADDQDAAVLDIGRPFVAVIDGTAYGVEGGRLELTSAMPATYKVSVTLWPFIDYEAEVAAA